MKYTRDFEATPLRPGRPVAPYACSPAISRGRLHPEAACPNRTPFQRDRDRIIHSSAFRRLTYKTQVFIYHEGDHYRTRLTHSLEVAQIARTIARTLGLDEDLAEAIALAHDLGHTPFGHAGEEALNEAMAAHGGFDHNAQSLRIVTALERRYAAFDGLNLTWEALEGLVKHNGPLTHLSGKPAGRYKQSGLPHGIRHYGQSQDLMLWTHASAEGQAAAIADDIAYNNHDIDDGLRAGLIALKDLYEAPLAGRVTGEVEAAHGVLPQQKLIHEVNRRLITAMIIDVLAEAKSRLGKLDPQSPDDIRNARQPVIAFSKRMTKDLAALQGFLYARVYRHPKILRIQAGAQQIVRGLYGYYWARPAALPEEWRIAALIEDPALRARHVGDFVAGMTDRFAIKTHKRLFDATPELR